MKNNFGKNLSGKFVVRCDTDLLQRFDEIGTAFNFPSRNEFIKYLIQRAVDEKFQLIAVLDLESLKQKLLDECEKFINKRIFRLMGESEKNDKEN